MLPFLLMNMPAPHLHFLPEGARARQLDAKAHIMLADSLEHIRDQAARALPNAAALSPVVARLRASQRLSPACFGLYYQLALALMDDRLDEAHALAARLSQRSVAPAAAPGASPAASPGTSPAVSPGASPGASPDTRPDASTIVALDELPADTARLYQDLMDTDPQTSFAMLPPSAALASAFRARYQQAFRRLQAAMPALAEEISALVRELVMVTGDPQASYQFDGGSSYMLWGGLFLNIASHETDTQLIEVLAHESAHLLLFGLTLDEPLVLNEDSALFTSPLRIDARPMDGIYHATFVSARMHWAMSQWLAGASLSTAECAQAEAARQADAENFKNGHEVVRRHGKLTATGQAVMEGACRYMEAFV